MYEAKTPTTFRNQLTCFVGLTSRPQSADSASEAFPLHSAPAAGEAVWPRQPLQGAAGDLQPGTK